MDELTRRRLVHNEQLFREVNEERQAAGGGEGDELTVVCECADPSCHGRIRLGAGEYAAVRDDPRRFLILPGHEIAEIETIVEAHRGYEVIQKRAA